MFLLLMLALGSTSMVPWPAEFNTSRRLERCQKREALTERLSFVNGLAAWRPAGGFRDPNCPPSGHLYPCSLNCQFESCCYYGGGPTNWYGDTCNCPYDCINCNGGVVQVLPPNNEPEGFHYCVCPAGKQGIDCRDCTESGCPSPQICSHTVFFDYHKVYDCLPGQAIQHLFPGRFVWEANFPPDGGPGNLSMTMFDKDTTSPVVGNCTLTQVESCAHASSDTY
jgi:hypothetical protein